jgi:predicted AAA+ superfamily ATPase
LCFNATLGFSPHNSDDKQAVICCNAINAHLEYASDVSNLDNTQRDPQKVKALMRALARNSATAVTNEALKWDISQGLGSISALTVSAYLAALKRIFVLAELHGWAPDIRAKARMRTSPKRYLADPSLTVAALGTTPEQFSGDPATPGVVFEGLCLRNLMAYSGCIGARLYHYRDNSGLEVDFILEHKNGSYAAIEAKLSPASQPRLTPIAPIY